MIDRVFRGVSVLTTWPATGWLGYLIRSWRFGIQSFYSTPFLTQKPVCSAI